MTHAGFSDVAAAALLGVGTTELFFWPPWGKNSIQIQDLSISLVPLAGGAPEGHFVEVHAHRRGDSIQLVVLVVGKELE